MDGWMDGGHTWKYWTTRYQIQHQYPIPNLHGPNMFLHPPHMLLTSLFHPIYPPLCYPPHMLFSSIFHPHYLLFAILLTSSSQFSSILSTLPFAILLSSLFHPLYHPLSHPHPQKILDFIYSVSKLHPNPLSISPRQPNFFFTVSHILLGFFNNITITNCT